MTGIPVADVVEGWVGHEGGEGPAHLVVVQVGGGLRRQEHEHESEGRSEIYQKYLQLVYKLFIFSI